MKYFYYFAYGSNLLKERIRVQNKGAEYVCNGTLNGFKLAFVHESQRWKGGLATILGDEKEQVCGCVWKVPLEYSPELDKQECGYHRLTVPVQCAESVIECRTYQFSDLDAELKKPSPHYKTVILAGAVEHGLPEPYIKKLYGIDDNGFRGVVEVDLDVIRTLNVQK
ncbi:unnamed protein product [Auanema sp. JU1783]|nr:unnamed protein product [Auanema sp. JU1783]